MTICLYYCLAILEEKGYHNSNYPIMFSQNLQWQLMYHQKENFLKALGLLMEHTEAVKWYKVGQYLLCDNTILNKVAPCHDRIASITTITAHKTAACHKVID